MMSNKQKTFCRYCFSLVVLLCFTQSACLDETPILSKDDKKLVDSLYSEQRKILLLELDSICTTTFDARVAVAVDSIMKKRLKEIENLKSRK